MSQKPLRRPLYGGSVAMLEHQFLAIMLRPVTRTDVLLLDYNYNLTNLFSLVREFQYL